MVNSLTLMDLVADLLHTSALGAFGLTVRVRSAWRMASRHFDGSSLAKTADARHCDHSKARNNAEGYGLPEGENMDETKAERRLQSGLLVTKVIAGAVLISLLAAATPAQQTATLGDKNVLLARSEVVAKPPSSLVPDANYLIGPEDLLDVSVWKEPELTRTIPVRPDGKISLPLLNDVQAAGETPTQLAAHITDSLKRYVSDPQVTVIVSAINSQRIYLLGEITRPGAYPLSPGMTVLQAISSAGGLTQYAHAQKIYVLREADKSQQRLAFNYKEFLKGKVPEQNVALKVGDTIVVP